MKKIIWKYGLLAGVINAGLMFALMPIWMESKNFTLGEIFGYLSMILALSLIFLGIYQYRQRHNNGVISFLKALKVGILITLIASVIYVAGWMMYSSFMNPGMMDEYFAHAIEQVRQSGASDEEIKAKIEEMESFKEMYQHPLIQMGITFTEIFPVGLLMSIIAALVLKRKQAG